MSKTAAISPDQGTALASASAFSVLGDDGKVKTHIQLIPFGDPLFGRDGRGPYRLIDKAHAEQVLATTAAIQGSTDLFIDYDHQSFLAVPKGGEARAAGWIKQLSVEDDGIYADVDWTAAATAALEAREYRYISPYFRHLIADGRVTRLVNAGLTNSPNFEMAAIAAENHGDRKPMTKIAKALGLADDAGEDEIIAAIADMMEKSTAMSQLIDRTRDALGLEEGAEGDAIAAAAEGAVQAAANVDPTKYVPMAMYQGLQKKMSDDAEADAIASVDAAIEAGKLPPAQREWGLSLVRKDAAAWASFVAGAAPFAAGEILSGQPETKATSLTEAEAIACEMTGTSPEDFLKAKNEEHA
ncbi:MAG: phage protease [Blastomonas sp.]